MKSERNLLLIITTQIGGAVGETPERFIAGNITGGLRCTTHSRDRTCAARGGE